MTTLITIVHVIVCLFLMLTVLLQSGKSGMGGALGGGGNTQTVFGGSGASNFLRRLTVGAAVSFMLTSMLLAFFASTKAGDSLQRFGSSQAAEAELIRQQKEKALQGAGSGSGSGSDASAPLLPGSASVPPSATPPLPTENGSAPAPTPAPAPGPSGATPVETAPTAPAPVAPAPAAPAPAAPAPGAGVGSGSAQ